jgi:mRNA deadenylase 3'-5' endonuclease subunit Ccr4
VYQVSPSLSLFSKFRVTIYKGQPWNAFVNCTDENINWTTRCERILHSLITLDPDIICLQEVTLEENEDHQWVLPSWCHQLLDRGYINVTLKLPQKDWVRVAEYNHRAVGHRVPTSLVTFYKTSKFEEVIPSEHGNGSGIIIFLKFKAISPLRNSSSSPSPPSPGFSYPILAIHNIHLIGHPSKFDQHEHQLNGALKHFKHGIRRLQDTHHRHHIYEVICGDFNSDVDLSFHEEDDSLECITLSHWIASNGFQRVPTGKSWAKDSIAARVDHILFHSHDNDTKYSDYQLRIRDYYPKSDVVAEDTLPNGIPNEMHPSDHILLYADMDILSLT